jgi:CubicO group peptidase (beta-lactamase class C family)
MADLFPPTSGRDVHLGNWRQAPYSMWAFQHVSELLPVARIARPETFSALPQALTDIGKIYFDGPGGFSGPLGKFFEFSHGQAMVVLQNGQLIFEHYRPGFHPRDLHLVFSISKSMTSLVAGILQAQGKLEPNAPVISIVPEAANSAYGDALIRHVLDMTVGVHFEEAYLEPGSPFARYREAMGWNPLSEPANPPDLRSFLMTLPPDGQKHGEVFHYVSPNSDLLGLIVERAAGEAFAPLFERLIWQRLGAEQDCNITLDRLGAPRTAGGMSLSCRDLARVGEMMRHKGKVHNAQVIPPEFIIDLYEKGERGPWLKGDLLSLAPEGYYRNQWYVTGPEGAMMAIGIHGQWLYTDPSSGITIAKFSAQPEPVDDDMDQLNLAAFRAIIAGLSTR